MELLQHNKGPNYLLVECSIYVILILAWSQGHAMHLSSNSIHNVIDREYPHNNSK